MRFAAVPLLFLCVSAVLAQGNRLPVPGSSEQVEAFVLLSERSLKLTAAQRADAVGLARSLLAQAKDKANDATMRYVMLRESIETAARAGDVDGVSDAVNELTKLYDVSPLAATIHSLILLEQAPARMPAGKASVADFAFAALDEAIANDDYDAAGELVRLATNVAAKRKDAALAEVVASRSNDVKRLREEHQRVRTDVASLKAAPDNAEVCDRVGRFFCFVKGDWEAGLPLLAKGKDETLKALAQKELRGASDLATRSDLADGWWKVAGGLDAPLQREVRIHAGAWYRLAAKDLGGDAKQTAETRIAEADKLMVGRPAPRRPTISNWTVVFRSEDPSIWNTDVNDGKRFARSLESVPADRVRYLKIVETQTKEFVIVELSKDKLGATVEGNRYGWNGRNHNDSGAYHLGVYDRQMVVKNGEVCIRTIPWYAGWGFGHLHFVNNIQGYCWAGRNIQPTTFEISVSPGPLTEFESGSLLKNAP